jgi:hypothetical protein
MSVKYWGNATESASDTIAIMECSTIVVNFNYLRECGWHHEVSLSLPHRGFN